MNGDANSSILRAVKVVNFFLSFCSGVEWLFFTLHKAFVIFERRAPKLRINKLGRTGLKKCHHDGSRGNPALSSREIFMTFNYSIIIRRYGEYENIKNGAASR